MIDMIDGIPNRPRYFYQKDIIVCSRLGNDWLGVSDGKWIEWMLGGELLVNPSILKLHYLWKKGHKWQAPGYNPLMSNTLYRNPALVLDHYIWVIYV